MVSNLVKEIKNCYKQHTSVRLVKFNSTNIITDCHLVLKRKNNA